MRRLFIYFFLKDYQQKNKQQKSLEKFHLKELFRHLLKIRWRRFLNHSMLQVLCKLLQLWWVSYTQKNKVMINTKSIIDFKEFLFLQFSIGIITLVLAKKLILKPWKMIALLSIFWSYYINLMILIHFMSDVWIFCL